MLHNFSNISDSVLTQHSDTVYSEHIVTIQCGTVLMLYIYSSTVMTICTVTLYNNNVYIYSGTYTYMNVHWHCVHCIVLYRALLHVQCTTDNTS